MQPFFLMEEGLAAFNGEDQPFSESYEGAHDSSPDPGVGIQVSYCMKFQITQDSFRHGQGSKSGENKQR
jgi:hypothetical protein